jgi:hypothetical protein
MGIEFETYAFFNVRPEHIPDGLVLLSLSVTETGGLTKARLLEPSKAFPGMKTIEIDPGLWSSCSRWGPIEGPVFALGIAGEWSGKPIFRALQLRREMPRRTRAERDRYIIDPQYLELARKND